jgi:bla regulator protein blaR1
MDTLTHVVDILFARLAWTAAQATLLIGAVWLLTRYLPRLSPAMRCMLWWLVGLQLVLGVTVSTPVELHWLKAPAQPIATVSQVAMTPTPDISEKTPAFANIPLPEQTAPITAEPVSFVWSWSEVIVAIWLLGVLLHSLLAARHWRESRSLFQNAKPVKDAALRVMCAEQARKLGLRRPPQLRTSDAIVSPQVTGLLRPVVLLPSEETLSSDELAMALAHELAHLHRGDLWMGWIPAVAQRLFFFHPLVKWAMREYAIYREAACDAQVLHQQHAAPHAYGHLLVRLGVAMPVHSSLAGASTTFQGLKRRLLMLQQGMNDTAPRARGWLLVAVIALAGVLPYRVTATNSEHINDTMQGAQPVLDDDAVLSSMPSIPSTPLSPAPATSAAPAARPTIAAAPKAASAPDAFVMRSVTSVSSPVPAIPAIPATPVTPATPATPTTPATPPTPPTPPTPATPATPPTPATPATPPTPPTPPIPAAPSTGDLGIHVHHMDIDTQPQTSRGIALFDGDSMLLNGSDADLVEIHRLNKTNQPTLWFRRGDKAYVIHDADVIRRAKDAILPISRMAQEQARLAAEQSALAGQQDGLAERQRALAGLQAMLASQRARLEAQRAELMASTLEPQSEGRAAMGEIRGINDHEAEIERQSKQISEQAQMLTEHEAAMSAREAAMSAQQKAASEQANQQLDSVLDEAMSKGLAQPDSR